MKRPTTDPRFGLYRRLYGGGLAFAGTLLLGASVFHVLGEGRWAWADCFYMTVVTISTVGFAEVLPNLAEVQFAREWTMVLIVIGSGTLLYFASTLTALIIEGDIRGILRRKKMEKAIEKLDSHVVICGVGSTGMYLVEELILFHETFVVVDKDLSRVERVREEVSVDFPYVIGDATDDASLQIAGIKRARGVLAALHDDKDNVFVTITARALNPHARIVSKAVESSAEAKLKRAGADSVVSPNFIGGMRMASEMIRPSVVEFLDRLMRDRDMKLRIDELDVQETSPAAGLTLADSGIRDGGALVLCARKSDGDYHYNPSADFRIIPGTTLIIIGKVDDLLTLRKRLS